MHFYNSEGNTKSALNNHSGVLRLRKIIMEF